MKKTLAAIMTGVTLATGFHGTAQAQVFDLIKVVNVQPLNPLNPPKSLDQIRMESPRIKPAETRSLISLKDQKIYWPVVSQELISHYGFDQQGNFHTGTSFSANPGDNVIAVFGGKVNVLGNSVTISNDGVELVYTNIKPLVEKGLITSGQVLGQALGNVRITAQKGGMVFDIVSRWWPQQTILAALPLPQPPRLASISSKEMTVITSTYKNYEDVVPSEMAPIFDKASKIYCVNVNLLKAVAYVESGFDQNKISSKGAVGVMQLMPDTAMAQGVTDINNISQNIYGGARYLREQLIRFNGDVNMALAAYNAGPGAVIAHDGIPPIQETQNYVAAVMAIYKNMGGVIA